MTKEDIKKGVVVYYARMLNKLSVYEVCELSIRTVTDDYFVGIEKRDKSAHLFSYNDLNKIIFDERKLALQTVKMAMGRR